MLAHASGIKCPKGFRGFVSWQELARLVWECDIGSADQLRKFLRWKGSDRSKRGLLRLGKRGDFRSA